MFSINIIKQLNRCDFFFFLWVIYYLQGIIYPEGGIISISILAINLLISVYYAIKVIEIPDKPVYFKGLTCLLIMFSIYGILLIVLNGVTFHYGIANTKPSYNYIKSIYLSLLPIFPFFYFTVSGYLTEGRLKKWIIIFFFSCTLTYFKTKQQELLSIGSDQTETTNNAGYLFLSLLPAVILYKKKPILMLVCLLYIMAFIIMGMKRGAIIIGALIFLYLLYSIWRTFDYGKKLQFFIIALIAIIGAVYLVFYQMETSEYALQRIADTKEGNSSGRDIIFHFFWNYFTNEADLLHYLVGRGAYGTLEIYHKFAHNDWLELAINQGLLGIGIYLFYWICLYKTWKNCTNLTTKSVLFMIGLICFIKTLFSMSYEDMTFLDTSILGFALASNYKFEIDDDEQIEDSMLFVIE